MLNIEFWMLNVGIAGMDYRNFMIVNKYKSFTQHLAFRIQN